MGIDTSKFFYQIAVGLLFNPAKVVLRSQLVKYCGFIYDTAGIPSVEVPPENRDRALAMLDNHFTTDHHGRVRCAPGISRCDSARLGPTFLRRAYNPLYAGVDLDFLPAEFHYSMVRLLEDTW